jgi:2,3-bisphosphoglycerate-independent phosphoglycerate mutase
MIDKLKLINEMALDNGTKIVLLLMDGLGGLPLEPGGPTELEAAHTPNMDTLAAPVADQGTWHYSVTTRWNT